jgi:hypothetical protein
MPFSAMTIVAPSRHAVPVVVERLRSLSDRDVIEAKAQSGVLKLFISNPSYSAPLQLDANLPVDIRMPV